MHQKVPTSHKQTLYKYLYFITRTNTTVNVETIRLIKQKKSDNQLIVALYIQLLRNSSEKFVKEYHLQLPVGSGFHDFMQAIPPLPEDLSQFFVFFVRVIWLDNSSFRSTNEIQHHITLRTLGNLLLNQFTSV